MITFEFEYLKKMYFLIGNLSYTNRYYDLFYRDPLIRQNYNLFD